MVEGGGAIGYIEMENKSKDMKMVRAYKFRIYPDVDFEYYPTSRMRIHFLRCSEFPEVLHGIR